MLQDLKTINKKIEQTTKDESLKYHYFGTFVPLTNVMFIGERPSLRKNFKSKDWYFHGNFWPESPTGSDSKFVNLLVKYGFGGSYITDIVKSCAPAGDKLSDALIDKKWFDILLEEIETVKPKIIVALGNKAELKLLKRKNKLPQIPILKIWHPAYPRGHRKWEKYELQISNLQKVVNSPNFLFTRGRYKLSIIIN